MRWIECLDDTPPENKLVLCYSDRGHDYFVGFYTPLCGFVQYEGTSKVSCTKWLDVPLDIPDEEEMVKDALTKIFGKKTDKLYRYFLGVNSSENSSD